MKTCSFLSFLLLLLLGPNRSFGDDLQIETIKPIHIMGSLQLKHDRYVSALACSSDGELLASYAPDGMVRLWDTKTFKMIWESKDSQMKLACGLAFSPDPKYLAIATSKGPFSMIEVSSGKALQLVDTGNLRGVDALAFSPDGKWVAFGELVIRGEKRLWEVSVWDFKQRKEVYHFGEFHPKEEHFSLSFSPDSNYLASGYDNRKVSVWNLKTGKKEYEVDHESSVLTVAFSPKGDLLVTLDDKGVHIRNPKSGKEIRTIKCPKQQHYRHTQFSPDGTLLATGNSHTGEIALWKVETGKVIQTLKGHGRSCEVLCFSPDGKRIYSGSYDGTIRVWDLTSGKELLPKEDHAGHVASCTFSPDGSFFLSGGYDEWIRKWDTQTGKVLDRFHLEGLDPYMVVDLAATKEAYAVVINEFGDDDYYSIRLWDPKTRQPKLILREKGEWKGSIRFVEEGKNLTLFALLSTGDFVSWSPDFSSIKKLLDHSTLLCPPHSVIWGESRIAFLCSDKSNWFLVNPFYPKKPIRYHLPEDTRLPNLSPNERSLFTTHFHERSILWTTNPLSPRKTWEFVLDLSDSTRFSLDSRYLAIARGAYPMTNSLYEVATGAKLFDLSGPRAKINCLSFSPDHRFLLTGSDDSRLMLWDLRSFGEPEAKQTDVSEKELTRWWEDLRHENPQVGLKAVSHLVQSPTKSVAYLKTHLKPIESLSNAKIHQLIRDLDHANFAIRKKAFGELDDNSEQVEEQLQKELKNSPSSEVQNAITRILENLKKSRTNPNRNALRQIRAVQALEYIGTEEAKELLQGLSKGAPKALLTQEAQEALGRLERFRK
jgi:WD40 repeat protein